MANARSFLVNCMVDTKLTVQKNVRLASCAHVHFRNDNGRCVARNSKKGVPAPESFTYTKFHNCTEISGVHNSLALCCIGMPYSLLATSRHFLATDKTIRKTSSPSSPKLLEVASFFCKRYSRLNNRLTVDLVF